MAAQTSLRGPRHLRDSRRVPNADSTTYSLLQAPKFYSLKNLGVSHRVRFQQHGESRDTYL